VATAARALERQSQILFQPACFDRDFSPKIRTVVHKNLNRKVIDLASLYNFYKGRMAFFSANCAQFACQDGSSLGADE
jgi:hypothetical protein